MQETQAIQVEPSGQACGATVTGVDLTKPLSDEEVATIRAAWLEHHVLSFPGQPMSDDDLERFTRYFGGFGHDPFFAPVEGRSHIAAIRRDATETTPLFAENWHSDWSFQEHPPAGTCLMAVTVPPVGGDTLFADQHKALAALPEELRAKIEGKMGIHSAQVAYAPDGMYGKKDEGRSMDIVADESARETQLHPLIQEHPETGEPALFSTLGYIIGIEDMDQSEAFPILSELAAWQGREEFTYRHKWEPDMLVMWDNRSVLHCATGGYEGHDRLLHRTTIAAYEAA